LVGLVLSPIILLQFGWRALFYTFGLVGIPLLAIWLATAPTPLPKPPSTPSAAAASVAADSAKGSAPAAADTAAAAADDGAPVSIGRLLGHPATWAIIIVNIVNHWGYFIYLNWMPSYFVKVG
jgi:ACS family sodium-dependent inorganic phosphate cotransporter/ACS family sodium-dependent inorganic phosphate cotransporter-like MFS transporter 9